MLRYSIIVVIFILFILILSLIIKHKIKNSYIKKAGKVGEEFTYKILKRVIASSGAFIYHNIKLPLYDGTTEIDFLIIAPQGIICIENKHVVGVIKGNRTDQYWNQIKQYEKKTFYNPILQNEGHIKCLKYHLNKLKHDINVEGYVIFSNDKVELHLNIPNVGKLKSFENFYKKYIEQRKQLINVKEVCKIVDKLIK